MPLYTIVDGTATIPDALSIGATAVDRVYQGPEQIWPEPSVTWPPVFAGGDGTFDDAATFTFGPFSFTSTHALVAVTYRSVGITTVSSLTVGGQAGTTLHTGYNGGGGNTTRIGWYLVPATGSLSIDVTVSASVLRASVCAWSAPNLTAVAEETSNTSQLTAYVTELGSFVASAAYWAASASRFYVPTADQVEHYQTTGDGFQSMAFASQAVADPPDVVFTLSGVTGASGRMSNLTCVQA